MKNNFKLLALSACILASKTATAAKHQHLNESELNNDNKSVTLKLGSPASFLENLGLNQVATERSKSNGVMQLAQSDNQAATFTLPDNLGKDIQITAKSFSMEANGTLSMNGEAVGIPNSEFILQGNGDNVYGWVILRDQDVAYEYTTENGDLVVNKIAVTDVHPNCDFEEHAHTQFSTETSQKFTAARSAAHTGSYPGSHVGQLESKPGSSYVILLDTTQIMTNGVPHDVSKAFIWETWQIVAASFSMFDVNVTTNKNVYNNATPSKRGGGTMLRGTGRSSCAFAFGTSTFCTLYKESNGYGQGRIAAHELGHLFHLNHDGGSPGGEYHNGIAAYQWVPVMGNIWMATSWGDALYQWSKGEYSGASNTENDFNILTQYIPFRADDITASQALNVEESGNVLVANNTGLIEQNTDSDSFSFTIGASGGHVNFNIDRTEHIGGGMLDVQAYIKDSSGGIIASSNKSVNRSASFDQDLTAGNYTLEISGGAEGSPSHGFSNYSSLGYYGIAGNITGASNAPSISNIANGSVLNGTTQLFSWGAGNATSFKLYAGSSVGAQNYYSNNNVNGTAASVTGLPTNGETVHVTLHYLMNGVWAQSNHSYIAYDSTPSSAAGVTSPVEGSTLTGSTAAFTWIKGDATSFWLYAGSTEGTSDYYSSAGENTGTSESISTLPIDGSTIHLTFWTKKGATWTNKKYTYTGHTEANTCTAAPAQPGKATTSINSSTSFTANWGAVNKAVSYGVQLWVNDSTWQSIGSTAQTTYAFTNLNAGSKQYIRVNATNRCGSSAYGQWAEVSLPGGSTCTVAPANAPSGLAGNSQAINWSAVTGATSYDIQYWSDASNAWLNHGSSASTSYTLGLSGTQWSRVRATNSCGSSNYSSWVTLN